MPVEADRLFSLLTLSEVLKAAGESVVLTAEPDGVRIDLVDTEGRPLFESARGALTPEGRALVEAAAVTLAPCRMRCRSKAIPMPSGWPGRVIRTGSCPPTAPMKPGACWRLAGYQMAGFVRLWVLPIPNR